MISLVEQKLKKLKKNMKIITVLNMIMVKSI